MKLIKSAALTLLLTTGASTVGATEIEVKSGDTLWGYGKQYNVPYQEIMITNSLNSDLIVVGQKLTIPDGKIQQNHNNFTGSEIDVLASLVTAEAKGESYTGKVAVAAVVLNRMKNPEFPNSVTGVIYQSGQFSPVSNGSINQGADSESYRAAQAAMSGDDPTNGAIYFYNPHITSDHWIRTRDVIVNIGKHNFAK